MRRARLGGALGALFALGTAIASAQSPSPDSVGNALLSAKVDTAITSAKSVRIVVEGPTGPLLDIRRAGADRVKITRRGSSSPDAIIVGTTMYDRAADGSWHSTTVPPVKHPRKNQLYLGAPDTLLEPLPDRDEGGTPVGAFRSAATGNGQVPGTMDCTYDKVSYRPHVCTVSLKDLSSTMRVTYSGWNDDGNLVEAPAGAVPATPEPKP